MARPLLPKGGYNYKFVTEPPDSLKCLICLSVVKEPQQHAGCGKLFCKVCIDHYKQGSRKNCSTSLADLFTEQGSRKNCPHCRQPLADLFTDLRGEQEVKSLIVECKKSCGWSGELRLAKNHETNDCLNAIIPCPNECNNGSTKIIRKNVETHVLLKCSNRPYTCTKCQEEMKFRNVENHEMVCPRRQYNCPHCNEAGVYDELTTTHLTVCPKVEVRCSKCWGKILRCNKSKHHLVCPNEPVRCKYYNIGCGENPIRANVPKHEAKNAQIHLELATEEVLRLKNSLILKNTLTFQTNDSKLENTSIQSPPFYTSKKGYKICISIYPNGQSGGAGTHVSVYACLMKGDHDDTLTWPFPGSVTIELLNQLEDKNHLKCTLIFLADDETSKRVVDRERGPGRGYTAFISHAALDYDASANTQYLKNDTLVFRVSAEAPDSKPWLECTN